MRALLLVVCVAALPALPAPAETPVAQDRSVDPVVLTGAQFAGWSAGPDPTFREPQVSNDVTGQQSECNDPGSNPYDPKDNGDHNCTQASRIPHNPLTGAAVDRLLGYRWNTTSNSYEQIPFQVDERFTRYLTNNQSGFAFYSGADYHNTYVFDREGFRYSSDQFRENGGNRCIARPAPNSPMRGAYAADSDPVVGLDDDDELVFMYADTAGPAPVGAALPAGIESAHEVVVTDPSDPSKTAFAYVMLAAAGGPAPAFNASNGYVRYERDANADLFVYSQSSYGGYGAAPKGPTCREDGSATGKIEQRRPLDRAWVKTDRYHFRYDGRWLMTQLRVSPDDSGLAATPTLGADMIDQWKARAFQLRPGGQTPCCGYEEEVNNWGGSSILLGERWGPVRAVRASWGADSSTNNVRIETFYREDIRFGDALRVHVIPPFDGIYVFWDHTAGATTKYFNPFRPEGVPVDGRDDEVFGNSNLHVAQDRIEVRDGDKNVAVPLAGGDPNRCDVGSEDGICNDVDSPDPTFSGPVGNLNWEQVSGPFGSLVTRWTIKEHSAGDAYSLIALPYYRDDACFDDGTGQDPGPHLRGRAIDAGLARADKGETFAGDASKYLPAGGSSYVPRECWAPSNGDPSLDPSTSRRFVQGSIGTHGLHLQLIADSDNAMMTVPVDEIVSEQRMVVLRGDQPNVGERYGRNVEFPLGTAVRRLP